MADTLPFSKLTKNSDDIFELVVAAAKRARQINALRMAQFPLPTLNEEEEETFDETPQEEDSTDWDGMEKPTTMALNELLDTKINYEYVEPPKDEPKSVGFED
jgi:DNA-directed RNA polymerase omega subunit